MSGTWRSRWMTQGDFTAQDRSSVWPAGAAAGQSPSMEADRYKE